MLPINPLLNATAPAGPHLPVALLRQYAAGALATAAQHRVEAHTLACPRCADVLAGLLQTPPATTDQALAQLQLRLRQRVQQAAPARQLSAPRQHRWLAPQLAAAAALLLGLVAGGWWAWQQRHLAPATAPVAMPPPTRSPTLVAAPAQQSVTKATTTAGAAATLVAPRSQVQPNYARPLPDPAMPTKRAAGLALRNSSTDAARVRVAAVPVGGLAALRERLRRAAAKFVPKAPERALSGTVQLRVTIGATGKIEKIIVLRGLRADYDAEAQRLVCEGSAWVPGTTDRRQATQVADVAVPF